ncbi:MAG: hypothetical protein V1836_02575 [Candidatus Aenigmatarchaeota archaeon]
MKTLGSGVYDTIKRKVDDSKYVRIITRAGRYLKDGFTEIENGEKAFSTENSIIPLTNGIYEGDRLLKLAKAETYKATQELKKHTPGTKTDKEARYQLLLSKEKSLAALLADKAIKLAGWHIKNVESSIKSGDNDTDQKYKRDCYEWANASLSSANATVNYFKDHAESSNDKSMKNNFEEQKTKLRFLNKELNQRFAKLPPKKRSLLDDVTSHNSGGRWGFDR